MELSFEFRVSGSTFRLSGSRLFSFGIRSVPQRGSAWLIFVAVLILMITTSTRYRVVVLTSLRLLSLLDRAVALHDQSELET